MAWLGRTQKIAPAWTEVRYGCVNGIQFRMSEVFRSSSTRRSRSARYGVERAKPTDLNAYRLCGLDHWEVRIADHRRWRVKAEIVVEIAPSEPGPVRPSRLGASVWR